MKRYEPGVWEVPIERGYIGRLQKLTMLPAPDGEWVKAEDYAAMAERAAMVEIRVAELERELEGSRAIALETQLAQAQTNLDLKKRVAELERSLARRLPPNEPANR